MALTDEEWARIVVERQRTPNPAPAPQSTDGEAGACSWAKANITGRGDIIGFRLDENENIEYLCHNEALCNPYYLAKERRDEVR